MRCLVAALALLVAFGAGCDGCAPSSPDGGAGVADASGTPLADGGPGDDDGGRTDGGGAGAEDAGDDAGGGDDDDGGSDGGNADGGSGGDGQDGGDGDAGGSGLPCPGAGLALRLTWTTIGDLDLHLSLDGADWCSDEDCWWANCAPDADLPLEWDGVPGASAGDPRLLDDDADGFGPEVICLEEPFVAEYVVGVRYETFSQWPGTTARLELLSGGQRVDEVTLEGLSPGGFWEPGRVVVSASDLAFVVEPRLCESSDGWICQDAPGACPALP